MLSRRRRVAALEEAKRGRAAMARGVVCAEADVQAYLVHAAVAVDGAERSDALADAMMMMMMETARTNCDGNNGDKLGQGLARPGRL